MTMRGDSRRRRDLRENVYAPEERSGDHTSSGMSALFFGSFDMPGYGFRQHITSGIFSSYTLIALMFACCGPR